MKKTIIRSTKELLIIVRDNLETSFKGNNLNGGLCAVINDLQHDEKITYDE